MSRKIEKKMRDELPKSGEFPNFGRSVLGYIDEIFCNQRHLRDELDEIYPNMQKHFFEKISKFHRNFANFGEFVLAHMSS